MVSFHPSGRRPGSAVLRIKAGSVRPLSKFTIMSELLFGWDLWNIAAVFVCLLPALYISFELLVVDFQMIQKYVELTVDASDVTEVGADVLQEPASDDVICGDELRTSLACFLLLL